MAEVMRYIYGRGTFMAEVLRYIYGRGYYRGVVALKTGEV
jgi:hypothetical protein